MSENYSSKTLFISTGKKRKKHIQSAVKECNGVGSLNLTVVSIIPIPVSERTSESNFKQRNVVVRACVREINQATVWVIGIIVIL